jgi:ADP-ribosylglycohydrolase
MLGAIVGDFIGSSWEGVEPFRFRGELLCENNCFTDDTVLTIATGYALAVGQGLEEKYRESILDYHDLGFSESLLRWAGGVNEQQYFNCGNGAAIRVSPVVLFSENIGAALELARMSASVTHYNEEAICLAELVGGAVFLAHRNGSPDDIRRFAVGHFPSLYERLRSGVSYQWESVITAIEIACQTRSFEACMRKCISAGGDVDSVCAMAGGISEGLWGCPSELLVRVLEKLQCLHPDLFCMLKITTIGRLPKVAI